MQWNFLCLSIIYLYLSHHKKLRSIWSLTYVLCIKYFIYVSGTTHFFHFSSKKFKVIQFRISLKPPAIFQYFRHLLIYKLQITEIVLHFYYVSTLCWCLEIPKNWKYSMHYIIFFFVLNSFIPKKFKIINIFLIIIKSQKD